MIVGAIFIDREVILQHRNITVIEDLNVDFTSNQQSLCSLFHDFCICNKSDNKRKR